MLMVRCALAGKLPFEEGEEEEAEDEEDDCNNARGRFSGTARTTLFCSLFLSDLVSQAGNGASPPGHRSAVRAVSRPRVGMVGNAGVLSPLGKLFRRAATPSIRHHLEDHTSRPPVNHNRWLVLVFRRDQDLSDPTR